MIVLPLGPLTSFKSTIFSALGFLLRTYSLTMQPASFNASTALLWVTSLTFASFTRRIQSFTLHGMGTSKIIGLLSIGKSMHTTVSFLFSKFHCNQSCLLLEKVLTKHSCSHRTLDQSHPLHRSSLLVWPIPPDSMESFINPTHTWDSWPIAPDHSCWSHRTFA